MNVFRLLQRNQVYAVLAPEQRREADVLLENFAQNVELEEFNLVKGRQATSVWWGASLFLCNISSKGG